MCGINGIVQFRKKWDRETLGSLVHRMNERIIYRGPDSEGLYSDDACGLGMRRLSIIDVAGGSQPIWNETKDICIVFNGEIYNFQALRDDLLAKGHVFATRTDTEAILHGYEEYGTGVFDRLEGMYAVAIYDKPHRQWVLARDRFGEKPLYYYMTSDALIFGSELQSLLSTGEIPKEIDRAGLSAYFQLTYIPAPLCIIHNVKKLPAAHYMVVKEGGTCRMERYWQLDIRQRTDMSYEDAKARLRELFTQSVASKMVSDVPLGAFLSGGLDSSTVVATMAGLSSSPINTFTVGMDDPRTDESLLAKQVADRYHTRHTRLRMNWDEAIRDIDTIFDHMGEPFADSSLIATHAISKQAGQFVKVVLTGDAGDELFAGYDKYLIQYYSEKYNALPGLARRAVAGPGLALLPKDRGLYRKAKKVVSAATLPFPGQQKWLMSLGFKADECGRLFKDSLPAGIQPVDELYAKDYNTINMQKITQYVDLHVVLEGDMLAKVDRGSMLASVETRVPMLSQELVEFVFSLPSEWKISGKKKKIIFRDTFGDVLPPDLLTAPKSGFGVPIGQWLRTELRSDLERYSSTSYLEAQGLFNAPYIQKIVSDHLSGRENRSSELWTFYAFQRWGEKMGIAM